ncbi:MAG: hypothetical protein AB1479_07415 [Pseudomonadota bacterium]
MTTIQDNLPNILILAGDPGGANALTPVIRALLDDGRCRLVLHAYRHALDLWRQQGFDVHALPAPCLPRERLEQLRPDLLLCATSCNGEDWEQAFIAAANELGIPSLALLDFWSNYRQRFTSPSRLLTLPDCIAVMDDLARHEMIEEGFDPARLIVTGQPVFDALPQERADFTASDRRRAIRADMAGDKSLILFASQPIASLYRDLTGNPRHLGYDERQTLNMLVEALDTIGSTQPLRLHILPHPREARESFTDLHARHTEISVSEGQYTPHDLVMSADIVVGMNSMLLVEACLLGALVLSLQPGLSGRDALPTNRAGASLRVSNAGELERSLRELLYDESKRQTQSARLDAWRPMPGATARVAGLVYRMIARDIP